MANPKELAEARKLRCRASAASKVAGGAVRFAGQDVDDAVRAAARITLANRWGFDTVYWYGDETAQLLADQDLELIYIECDKLLANLRNFALTPEDTWHGQDERTSEPDDPSNDDSE